MLQSDPISQDIKDLGLVKVGHIKRLLNAINELKAACQPQPGSSSATRRMSAHKWGAAFRTETKIMSAQKLNGILFVLLCDCLCGILELNMFTSWWQKCVYCLNGRLWFNIQVIIWFKWCLRPQVYELRTMVANHRSNSKPGIDWLKLEGLNNN